MGIRYSVKVPYRHVYLQCTVVHVCRSNEKKNHTAIWSDTIWQNVRYKFRFKGNRSKKRRETTTNVYQYICWVLWPHTSASNVSISKRSQPILRNCTTHSCHVNWLNLENDSDCFFSLFLHFFSFYFSFLSYFRSCLFCETRECITLFVYIIICVCLCACIYLP